MRVFLRACRLIIPALAILTGCDSAPPMTAFEAAMTGNVAALQRALRSGTNPNAVDANGQTPLHYAAGAGRLDATRTLVQRGAAVNEANSYGDTPLHKAAAGCHFDLIQYLLDSGSDDRLRNKHGEHHTRRRGSGPRIRQCPRRGGPGHAARGQTPCIGRREEHLPTVRALVEAGEPRVRRTPTHLCTSQPGAATSRWFSSCSVAGWTRMRRTSGTRDPAPPRGPYRGGAAIDRRRREGRRPGSSG
jgi:hypothetical protein